MVTVTDSGLSAFLIMHGYKYFVVDKKINFDIELNTFVKLKSEYKTSSFRKFHKINKKIYMIQK